MLNLLQNILAWLLVVGIVGCFIAYIRSLISKARRPADKSSDLQLTLPPASASLDERLARLRLNLRLEFKKSLRENILFYMFLALVLGVSDPPPLFSGWLQIVCGIVIDLCLLLIMAILMDSSSLYASYRSLRLRILLDAQHKQAEQL